MRKFWRDPRSDIVLKSPLVSHEHGRFCCKNGHWSIEDRGVYKETGSTNGLLCNNMAVLSRSLCEGDLIRIDDGVETISEGVLFVFSSTKSESRWKSFLLEGKREFFIGRDPGCEIMLPHVTVSRFHAKIVREPSGDYIIDNRSTNGIAVNNRRVVGKQLLHEKDVISVTNSKMIYTSSMVFYCCYKNGISVDASNVLITRGKGRKSDRLCSAVGYCV